MKLTTFRNDGRYLNLDGETINVTNGTFDFTTTGTITSGDITIFDATPILVFKDSNSLGAASVGFIEWRDSGGGRAGFFGNSSSGNDDLLWKNEQGGNIGIQTTGGGNLDIIATLAQFNATPITTTGKTTTNDFQVDGSLYSGLVPEAGNTYDLGTVVYNWNQIFGGDIYAAGAVDAFDILADNYYDQGASNQWGDASAAPDFTFNGTVKIDSGLVDTNDVLSIEPNNRILTDENNAYSVDFTSNRFLADSSGNAGLNWANRQLLASDGSDVILDWSSAGTAAFGDSDITTTGLVTGYLRASAGTTTVAPLKVATGTALTTPEAGAIEFHNDRFYITDVAVRRSIDRSSDVIVATTTVANTVNETTIYTSVIGANALKVGNNIHVNVSGIISNATAADDITINCYVGTDLIESFNPAVGNITNADWHGELELTVRTVGGSGTIASHGHMEIDGNVDDTNELDTIDTTAAEDITVKVIWDNAKAGNTISIYQGSTHWTD